MKLFVGSIAGIIVLSVLFFMTVSNAPIMSVGICPAALIAIWLNGFALRAMNVRISFEDQQQTRPQSNRSPVPARKEFQ